MSRRSTVRALLALSLALGCALAAASIAYASTESTYATWVATGANETTPTPHKGYSTTTTKCAVCHAVHKAPAGGELLLRTTVEQACVYCHIENDIGGVVYGGNTDNYTIESDHGHQTTASGGVTCVDCHAVHGANTFEGHQATKILKVWNIQQSFVTSMSPIGGEAAIIAADGPDGFLFSWDAEAVQDAAFCSQCHPYYSGASEDVVTAQVIQSDGTFQSKSFKTHPLKVPGGENGMDYWQGFVAQGSTLDESLAVAVYRTIGCYRSCHAGAARDAGSGVPSDDSYPHYSAATSRFLASGGANRDGHVVNSSDDSNCLMCHVWFDGQGGVGPKGGTANPVDGGVGLSY
jgi:predicted CXXCH cytochrome family protein